MTKRAIQPSAKQTIAKRKPVRKQNTNAQREISQEETKDAESLTEEQQPPVETPSVECMKSSLVKHMENVGKQLSEQSERMVEMYHNQLKNLMEQAIAQTTWLPFMEAELVSDERNKEAEEMMQVAVQRGERLHNLCEEFMRTINEP